MLRPFHSSWFDHPVQSVHYTPVSLLGLRWKLRTIFFYTASLICLDFIILKTPKSASFAILCSREWKSLTDASEPIGPHFKGQGFQDGPRLVCGRYGAIRIALVCKNGGPRATRSRTEYFLQYAKFVSQI
jgi:hypothetical protein